MKPPETAPAQSPLGDSSSRDVELKAQDASPGAEAGAPVPADIRGPSADDWDRHKRLIISLYGTMKLKDIRARMTREHNFHATKRMYDRRFHKWGVSKYVKRAKPTQAKPRSRRTRSPQPSGNKAAWAAEIPPIREDPGWGSAAALDVWRRATMHSTVSPDNAAYDDSVESQSSESSDATISGGSWIDSKEEVSHPAWSPTSMSPASPPCCCDDDHHHQHGTECAAAADRGGNDAPMEPEESSTSGPTVHVLNPVPRDASAFDLEHVLSSLKAFCSSHFDARNRVQDYRSTLLDDPTSPAVRRTWMQLHDCIYLFKLNDTRHAMAGLEEISRLPASSLIDPSPQVALEVIASLAPINTTGHPRIRSFVLSHLLRAAHSELGALHPITIICTQLSRDGGVQDVSRTALACLARLVSSGRSRSDSGKDAAAFRLHVRLAAVDMLRRETDYLSAARLAKEILLAAEQEFGAESPQCRRAARKLTHVYLDSGDYVQALGLCRSVVGRQTSAEAFSFRDYDAVRGMEDLAEVHRLRGEYQSSSLWLSAAAHLSARLLGKSLTTVHIVHKLLDMAKMAGQKEERLAYQRTYASFL